MSNQLLMRRKMMQNKKYNLLTFTAEAANSSVQLTAVGTPTTVTLEYNLNDGGWLPYTVGDTISLPNIGDNVKMRGKNATFSTSSSNYYKFVITGYVAASGDVTSLQNRIGGDIALSSYCYSSMFRGCTGLTAAPELPATTLATGCYSFMFYNCTNLTSAPELPATTLAHQCYANMFQYCSSLTTPPELPATTLADYCYEGMFNRCSSLTATPELPATTLAPGCYDGMFDRCTSLTTPPELPAMTLVDRCYEFMFSRCTSLTQAPVLPATTLALYCYKDMFRSTGLTSAPELPATTLMWGCYTGMFIACTNIPSHNVATLNNSQNTFNNNSSCTLLTIHAETPPTIASNTITGLKADCKICVPYSADHSILNAYKAAQYWRDRANYIFELDENGEIPS